MRTVYSSAGSGTALEGSLLAAERLAEGSHRGYPWLQRRRFSWKGMLPRLDGHRRCCHRRPHRFAIR